MARLKNPKYEAFAVAVMDGRSKTQAAIDAGYSSRTANQRGWQLSQVPEIAARIEELQDAAADAAIMSLREALIITSDIARDKEESAKNRLNAIDKIIRRHGGYEADNKQRGGELAQLIAEIQGTALPVASNMDKA